MSYNSMIQAAPSWWLFINKFQPFKFSFNQQLFCVHWKIKVSKSLLYLFMVYYIYLHYFLFCLLSWNSRLKLHNLIAFLCFPQNKVLFIYLFIFFYLFISNFDIILYLNIEFYFFCCQEFYSLFFLIFYTGSQWAEYLCSTSSEFFFG